MMQKELLANIRREWQKIHRLEVRLDHKMSMQNTTEISAEQWGEVVLDDLISASCTLARMISECDALVEREQNPVAEEVWKTRKKEALQEQIGREIGATFFPDQSVCCRMPIPPVRRQQRLVTAFTETVLLDLEQEIMMKLPEEYKPLKACYVIYINYFDGSVPLKKQPYFDNDNLAIKRILDTVLPYVCFDDSVRYCQNLYLTQMDSAQYAELWVVPKEALCSWISCHPELDFCRDLTRQ